MLLLLYGRARHCSATHHQRPRMRSSNALAQGSASIDSMDPHADRHQASEWPWRGQERLGWGLTILVADGGLRFQLRRALRSALPTVAPQPARRPSLTDPTPVHATRYR